MSRKRRGKSLEPAPLRVRPQELLLAEAVPEITGRRILCNSVGRAQFAAFCAEQHPEAQVRCFYFDAYQTDQARAAYADALDNLSFDCIADLPKDDADVFALAVKRHGEAELTRDLLQAGHQALVHGGRFLAAVDNPDDTWLHAEMNRLFPKVTRRPYDVGVLYLATKTQPLKKVKNFDAEFAFRDQGRLLRVYSRPGVFSHRRLDLGARALIESMTVREGDHVLDLGCGAGVVSLAAAVRAPGVTVLALDSNPRAVQCVERSSQLNGLTNITARLDAYGTSPEADRYDLVVANPPYYSNYRIAEVFLQASDRALRRGGRLQLVTKKVDWYAERVPELFQHVTITEARGYHIVHATKRSDRR